METNDKTEGNLLICATSNAHKLVEMRAMMPLGFRLAGLKDIGYNKEIPETQNTLEGNAWQKAQTLFDEIGKDCFAEDTGLEIDVLDGRPGVRSARYAGDQRNATDNMNLVLNQLGGIENRACQFRTVIALFWKGERHTFEGIVRGQIIEAPKGDEGFGYDPIFQPNDYDETFAELGAEEKNKISHRARAVRKLMAFLKEQNVGADFSPVGADPRRG